MTASVFTVLDLHPLISLPYVWLTLLNAVSVGVHSGLLGQCAGQREGRDLLHLVELGALSSQTPALTCQ